MPSSVFVPYNGSRATGNPMDAAAILRHAIDNGFDPVKLAALRDARSGELKDRIAADLRAGDPSGLADARGSKFALDDVTNDMESDPFTGAGEQKRVGDVQHTLDAAALTNRDEVGQAAGTMARRNAFSKFLLDRAPFEAATSPVGKQALDEASARKMAEARAGMDTRLSYYNATTGNKPPSAQVQGDLKNLDLIETLAPRILSQYEKQYPGIEKDPLNYGGVTDTVTQKLKKGLYGAGVDLRDEDTKQLVGLLRVVGAQPYMKGRPNQRVYEDIVSHLPDIGFSPGSDYQRIKQLLALTPDVRQSVMESTDPMSVQRQRFDPTTGARRPAAGGGLPAGVTVTRE